MSYAGPSTRAVRPPDIGSSEGDAPRPVPRETRRQEWPDASRSTSRSTAIFAAGVVLGLAVGAGAALLFAPESGAYTRRALARRGKRVTLRGRDAWDDLRDEFRSAIRDRKRAWRRRRAGRESSAD